MTKECFLNEIKTIAEHSDMVDLIKQASDTYIRMSTALIDMMRHQSTICFMEQLVGLDITMSLIASKLSINDKQYMELVADELAKRMKTINDKAIGNGEVD